MSADWQSRIIGDLLETIIDYRGKTPPKSKNGIPTLTAGNVKGGRIDLSSVSYVSKEIYDQWTTRGFPEPGDVIITTEAPVGEVAPFPSDQTYLITRRVMALRGKKGVLNNDFLLYVLQSPIYKDKLLTKTRGSTVSRVLKTDITGLEIALPSINEQKKIAGVLKTIDHKIELNNQINQTLESMAQAIFKSWFVDFDPVKAKIAALESGKNAEGVTRAAMRAISGKTDDELDKMEAGRAQDYTQLKTTAGLFPSAMQETELGEVPEGWEVSSLNDICHLNAKSWTNKNSPNEIIYADLANTKNGSIQDVKTFAWKDAPSRARRILTDGDTIIGTVRPGNKAFSFIGNIYPQLTASTGFAVLTPKKKHYREYLYIAATSEDNFSRMAHLADGGAYPAIRPNIVTEHQCVVPTEDLFSSFSGITKSMIGKLDFNKSEEIYLSQLRDTLLPKLLSGELSIDAIEISRGE